MQVQRRKDSKLPHVIMHKVADIRGGVSVNVSELGGDFLHEGAVLSAPINGICHVVKTAVVKAAVTATGTAIQVMKNHNFREGDFVTPDVNGIASAIKSIDRSNKAYDVITVTKALGAIAVGGHLVEAEQASDGTSALKYDPLAIVGTGRLIQNGVNLDTDAWLIAVTKGNSLPKCVSDKLKGIINY